MFEKKFFFRVVFNSFNNTFKIKSNIILCLYIDISKFKVLTENFNNLTKNNYGKFFLTSFIVHRQFTNAKPDYRRTI